MKIPDLTSPEAIRKTVEDLGFLPFFRNGVEGFSIEELTSEELWFSPLNDGPWEWKGPVIGGWNCAYGKFFAGKAGFVSLEWLPDFINWRRSVYPLEQQPDETRHVLEVLRENESLLSRELKKKSGYSLSRKRKKDLMGGVIDPNEKNGPACDKIILNLEMATYVCIADFEYNISREGERYGWGVARYCTPEAMYGVAITRCSRSPEESRSRIIAHMHALFPAADNRQWAKLI